MGWNQWATLGCRIIYFRWQPKSMAFYFIFMKEPLSFKLRSQSKLSSNKHNLFIEYGGHFEIWLCKFKSRQPGISCIWALLKCPHFCLSTSLSLAIFCDVIWGVRSVIGKRWSLWFAAVTSLVGLLNPHCRQRITLHEDLLPLLTHYVHFDICVHYSSTMESRAQKGRHSESNK